MHPAFVHIQEDHMPGKHSSSPQGYQGTRWDRTASELVPCPCLPSHLDLIHHYHRCWLVVSRCPAIFFFFSSNSKKPYIRVSPVWTAARVPSVCYCHCQNLEVEKRVWNELYPREPSIQQVSGAQKPGDLLLNTSLRKLSKGICLRVWVKQICQWELEFCRCPYLHCGSQFYLVLQIIAMFSVTLTWNIWI